MDIENLEREGLKFAANEQLDFSLSAHMPLPFTAIRELLKTSTFSSVRHRKTLPV
jgi:hypothetical protein